MLDEKWITINGRHILIKNSVNKESDYHTEKYENTKIKVNKKETHIKGKLYQSPRNAEGKRKYVSSEYLPNGRLHPVTKKIKSHHGVDIPGARGKSIPTIVAGHVLTSKEMNGYGNVVDITGNDGRIRRYAHLDSISVKEGQDVKAGDEIGKLGNTGVGTGPHLHYEVGKSGKGYNVIDGSKLQHENPQDNEVDFYGRVINNEYD